MKKALQIIKNVLVWIVIIFAAVVMIFTIVSMTSLDRNDRNILGFKFFIVQTDSMSATDFSAGDIIIDRSVDPSSLKEGDIITFVSQNSESSGQTVSHKIRKLTVTDKGEPAFITYGTTTNSDDETPVTYEKVIGKYLFHIPKVGSFLANLKSKPTNFLFILIPVGIFLLFQVFNVGRLIKKNKDTEAEEEADDERKKLEEEKRESEDIRQQLKELQAKIEAQQAAIAAQQQAANGGQTTAPQENVPETEAEIPSSPESGEKPDAPEDTGEQK